MSVITHSTSSPVENWAHTQSKEHKINFKWTIDNFSYYQTKNDQVIRSPPFSVASKKEIKFCLTFYPNGINQNCKGFLSIFLKIISEPTDEAEVLLKFRISILNSNLDKKELNKGQFIKLGQILGYYKFMSFEEVKKILQEDKLTFFCEISFVSDIVNIFNIGQFKMPERKLVDDLGNLLDNHIFSDVTLVVGKHEFPAHKVILATRSDVFAAMFEHEMEESNLNRVTITDIEHDVLQEMLRFIYTEDAPKLKEMAYQLLAAADKYALTKLKVMAERAIFDEMSIETAAQNLVYAEMHSSDQLKEKTIHFIKNHAKEIIKTSGWKNMKITHTHLIAEIFEALFTSTNEEH